LPINAPQAAREVRMRNVRRLFVSDVLVSVVALALAAVALSAQGAGMTTTVAQRHQRRRR
jgi:hypothetical protein